MTGEKVLWNAASLYQAGSHLLREFMVLALIVKKKVHLPHWNFHLLEDNTELEFWTDAAVVPARRVCLARADSHLMPGNTLGSLPCADTRHNWGCHLLMPV